MHHVGALGRTVLMYRIIAVAGCSGIPELEVSARQIPVAVQPNPGTGREVPQERNLAGLDQPRRRDEPPPGMPAPAVNPVDAVELFAVKPQVVESSMKAAGQHDVGVQDQSPVGQRQRLKTRTDTRPEAELAAVCMHCRRDNSAHAVRFAQIPGPLVGRAGDDDQVVGSSQHVRQRDFQEVGVIDADGNRFDSQGQVLLLAVLPIVLIVVPRVPALASISVPISEQSVPSIAKTACASRSREIVPPKDIGLPWLKS